LTAPVVAVLDYGIGNLRSAQKALEHVGADARLTADPHGIAKADGVVLPGVGAFGRCMEALRACRLDTIAIEVADSGRPFMGICVGMQILATHSEENGLHEGLGWIPGKIKKLDLPKQFAVPHVGWNTVRIAHAWGDFPSGFTADFYFDHSFAYGAPRFGRAVGLCQHGQEFSAIIQRDNITAVQFHPEKSQTAGLRLIEGFLRQ